MLSIRKPLVLLLLAAFSFPAFGESLRVGDIDFGPEVHFGTPALRGMRESYLRDSLLAYRDGTRQHKEMSAVAALLDQETIEFMACIACHGPLGEGSDIGPRLSGQNVLYIENQFEAFASGARQTIQSAIMQPVVAGLTDDDIEAVAHYYETAQELTGSEQIISRE